MTLVGAYMASRLLAMGESSRIMVSGQGYIVSTPYSQYPMHEVQWPIGEDEFMVHFSFTKQSDIGHRWENGLGGYDDLLNIFCEINYVYIYLCWK